MCIINWGAFRPFTMYAMIAIVHWFSFLRMHDVPQHVFYDSASGLFQFEFSTSQYVVQL